MPFGPSTSLLASVGRRNLRRWPLTGKHGNKNFYKGESSAVVYGVVLVDRA